MHKLLCDNTEIFLDANPEPLESYFAQACEDLRTMALNQTLEAANHFGIGCTESWDGNPELGLTHLQLALQHLEQHPPVASHRTSTPLTIAYVLGQFGREDEGISLYDLPSTTTYSSVMETIRPSPTRSWQAP